MPDVGRMSRGSQRRASLEIKVGAFIVAGLVLLGVFLFAIGDLSSYFQPGYTIRVRFQTANGIGEGSPVQYAGVEVGKVQDIQLILNEERPQVELLVRLPGSVAVRAADQAAISTFGLLGEKYLEITPGDPQSPPLAPGAMLPGKAPVSTEMVIERSNEVLSELKQTLTGLNSLVGDREARVYLQETLQEARDATRNWRLFAERMNAAMANVESGEGTVGKLLFDDTLHNKLVAFVEDLQQHPWKLLVRPKNHNGP
jgi:phospholipid/cholesterol/gamma-HCH transport system substrate-binding protein